MTGSGVTVIIPTFNERENIQSLVEMIFHIVPDCGVLVVDDHSPDGTAGVVRELMNRFPGLALLERTQDRGFGRSYCDGFLRVLQDGVTQTIVTMDADFSHDPENIPKMLKLCAQTQCDVVIGSRYVSSGGVRNWNWRRRVLSRFANWYARTILRVPVGDMTSGFMCISAHALRAISFERIHSDGYAFLVELKYLLTKQGAVLGEHPIIFTERREGQSKMSWKIIWESIWLPWKIRRS